MKRKKLNLHIDDIIENEFHRDTYNPLDKVFLKSSIDRTDGVPVYDIVVVASTRELGKYELISGASRFDYLIDKGAEMVDVILIENISETQIKTLVIDLNKYRTKSGIELKNELIHYSEMFPPKNGGLTNRYELIGVEMNISSDRIKKLLQIHKLVRGSEYEIVIEKILGGQMSMNKGKSFVKWFKNKKKDFSKEMIEKLIKTDCDFERLKNLRDEVDLTNESEFEIFKKYLNKTETDEEFNKIQDSLIKAKKEVEKHIEDQINVEVIDPSKFKNSTIIHGNSRTVDLMSIEEYKSKVRLIIGSCEYGYGTKRPTREFDGDHEILKEMDDKEFAYYIAEIYGRYREYLTADGSIYVIINDYKIISKTNKYCEYSCFTEHFVIAMLEQKYSLVERKVWIKNNPLPRQHDYADMVESYEYIYRFAVDKDNYCQRSLLTMGKDVEVTYRLVEGCTNHSPEETGIRGEKYIQSSLKKVRNALNNDYCEEIIRGNVGNPGDYFRQLFDENHSSTSPVYLTGVLTLNASEPGDLIMDVWNGVGNSMMSSLLLGRRYIGIEIEKNYYEQTLVKANELEKFVDKYEIMSVRDEDSEAA